MTWLEGLDNDQRRHHKKALDPDLPHPFRARRITADKADQQVRWYATLKVRPCAVCGGSKGDVKHL